MVILYGVINCCRFVLFPLEEGYESADYVFCPIVEQFHRLPKEAHPAVPSSIADRLAHLHGAPHAWFTGHLLAYFMRLQGKAVLDSVENAVQTLRGPKNNSPVVGLHIRRTDKVSSYYALFQAWTSFLSIT